jgi:type IV pilus assembly protein PilE
MKRNGFTLIELMIVLAVVAILATLALPSYNSYLARGKITAALAALADYRIKMEQYFQDNRNYGAAGASCPVAVVSSTYFSYSCLVGNTTPSVSYTATATSIAGALGSATGDYSYTLTEANAKATTKYKATAYSPGSKNCWLIRGDEC